MSPRKSPDILIINDAAFVNGGASQVAITSARGLADAGHRVIFFAAFGPVCDQLRGPNLEVILTEQADIVVDPARVSAALRGIWNRRAKRRLGEILRKLDPAQTVVHIHSWTKSLSASVVSAVLERGFKNVLTLHDYFSACPAGGFYDHGLAAVCELKPMSVACVLRNCDSRSYPHKVWRVMRHYAQQNLAGLPKRMRNFIEVSEFSSGILKPYLPEHNLFRAANPIAASKGAPVEVSRNQAFVMVGRLSPEKGPLLFAEAAKAMRVAAVFVGEGELRSEIRQKNPEARLTGWVSSEAVQQELQSARALVLPSVWYETQGMVVLEAAARGVPSIVADRTAAASLVKDGVTGLHFKNGDVQDLARKMELMKDGMLARRLGLAAYESFWQNPPTVERHVEELEACYEAILRTA